MKHLQAKEEISREIISLGAVLEQKVKERDQLLHDMEEKYSVTNLKEAEKLLKEKEKKLKGIVEEVKKHFPELEKDRLSQ